MPDTIELTDEDRQRQCAALAEQNDRFRRHQPTETEGQWVMTRAVQVKGPDFVLACFAAMSAYDDFTEENDPYGTHEMGFMEVMGIKVWWKIDLYDRAYEAGSPDPLSLAETRRVLTVLFPSDY